MRACWANAFLFSVRGDAYLICVRATASQEDCREAVLKELNDRDFSNHPREEVPEPLLIASAPVFLVYAF
jgi:hypothetical protein